MRTLASDLRFAARMLANSPAFALVAILSLALGIGANTAIFSLIDAVMLRMLPVSHPEQLVSVNTNAVKSGSVEISKNIDVGALREIQAQATTIQGLIGFTALKISIGVDGQAAPATAQFVTGNYYSLLGVPTVIGRTFEAKDDVPDGRLAVLGFGYWHTRFGGDPSVIGRSITVNNVPFTIVAVTPRDFYGTMLDQPPDVTIPQATVPQVSEGKLSAKEKRPEDSLGMVDARLKPGVSQQQAAKELTGLFQAVLIARDERERASIEKTWIVLNPAGQGFSLVRGRFSEPLRVLMGVVGLVMLIACANIANLLLARASARQREIAIRLSLGSTRWRLMRQLLTESLLLSLLGGALGVLLAAWARSGIIAMAGVQSAIPVQWNWRVLGFTAGVCILNAVLFGIVPALRATGIDFAQTLKSARSGRTAGRLPIARILVAAQVALSLALLVGAGLFLETFRNLNEIDLGYDRDHELMVTLNSRTAGYKGAAANEFYRQVLERVGTLPGVRSVSLMTMRLMAGNIFIGSIHVPGYTPKQGEDARNLWVISNEVGAGFANTSGLHLLAGRDFSERDDAAAPKVAIINETMAKHFFSDRDPIGRQVSWGRKDSLVTIVGVVRDFKSYAVQEDGMDALFSPFLQSDDLGNMTVLVRTLGPPERMAGDLRAAIRSIDAKVPQFDVSTMDEQVSKSLSQPRLLAILASVFGALAMGLAVLGLYGVLSYGVTQRTGEIGVRMALGALPSKLLGMILSETAILVAIGLVVGIGVTLAAGKALAALLQGVLYGIKPADVWPIAIAVAVLSSAALLAGFLPARRASRVDPMVALRHE